MTTEQAPSRMCPQCATPASEAATFCGSCGSRIAADQEPGEASTPPATAAAWGSAPAPSGPAIPGVNPKKLAIALGVALVVIAVVAGVAIVPGLLQRSPADTVTAFVQALGKRDAAAAQMLTDTGSMTTIAVQLGFAPVPKSVDIAVDAVIAKQAASTGSGSTATVTATWSTTYSLAGKPVSTGPAVVTATTFALTKGESGWMISRVQGGRALSFDLASFVGQSMADKAPTGALRDEVLADISSGVAWLDQVAVSPDQTERTVTAEPVITLDPDRMADYSTTVSPGSDGVFTNWLILVTTPAGPIHVEVGEEETATAVPAQITQGTLTIEGLQTEAAAALSRWGDLVVHGDASAADYLDKPVVTAAGWQQMASESPIDGAGVGIPGIATVTNAIVASFPNGFSLVRQAGGSWKIDTKVSNMLYDWLPGNGEKLVTTETANYLIDMSGCSPSKATMKVTMRGIAFYTRDLPVAIFDFTATTGKACAINHVGFDSVSGKAGDMVLDMGDMAVSAADASGNHTVTAQLPSTLTPADGTISITGTIKANPGVFDGLGRVTTGGSQTFTTKS